MIDQDLIQSNIARLRQKLRSMTATELPNLYVLENILDEKILAKLKKYLSTVPESSWQLVHNQEKKPRTRISWDSDNVVEELHEIFNSVTDTINDLLPGKNKNFWGVSIWRDLPGYQLKWHTDNPDIDVSLQIYLYSKPGLGTVFGSEESPLLISSDHNSGYLASHTDDYRIPHRTENAVPDGVVRYSLYVIWGRLPKHPADA